MKRTVPLIITALGGFVLIASYFVPATQGWGEAVAVWFDILASIAFILGGGSLLKQHLKKISDRAAGWGYSAVTLIAFLVTLTVGLLKFGSPPASEQEFYGQTFAPLAVEQFPLTYSVPAEIPDDPQELPKSVQRQVAFRDGEIVFRGWMLPNQKADLLAYENELAWKAAVEQLAEAAQPPEPLRGKAFYYANHQALAFEGVMQEPERDALLELAGTEAWTEAVAQLAEESRRTAAVALDELPAEVDPQSFPQAVRYDAQENRLIVEGPMSLAQRNVLLTQFPLARPLADPQRREFRSEIESRGGELNDEQVEAFRKVLEASWTVEQLREAINTAGVAEPTAKTFTEMYAEQQQGVAPLEPTTPAEGENVVLNEQQLAALREFAESDEMTIAELVEDLQQAGELTEAQAAAVRTFFLQQPTIGERNKALWLGLLKQGPLTLEQQNFLLDDFRREIAWRRIVHTLFNQAHVTKYEWSGDYAAEGTPFGWIYEYVFKPLTATMFALLAFYVASAAFRAFRAKNVEAILLLATAFIILLGRTFAGVWLTSWIPEGPVSLFGYEFSVAGFRIENLTIYIMSIFNTAGNRAIMIGIALGIASTSLKVLLGVDRSYLGSSEE